MKISEYLDIELLMDHLDSGHVRKQVHPEFPGLAILNYTSKVQIDGAWDDVTRKCRGLIYNDMTGEIVARPFEKFFNDNQPEAPDWKSWPLEDVRVREKMDGSLGIIYTHEGQVYVATRGSFASDQAQWATEYVRREYPYFQPLDGVTYLVEIIYPENRIVIDYDGFRGLVLLDVLDNESGESLMDARLGWEERHFAFPTAAAYNLNDLVSAGFPDRPNREGYVISNVRTGERVKIKHDEYKRLHKLITGVSTKTIWELLSAGESLDKILDVVPDEFYGWVKETERDLTSQFNRMAVGTFKAFMGVLGTEILRMAEGKERRKAFAQEIADSGFKDILFAYYDDRDVSPMIWKRLKPTYSKAFWNTEADD